MECEAKILLSLGPHGGGYIQMGAKVRHGAQAGRPPFDRSAGRW